jgi:Tfp pilus assembly protein PilF
MGGGDDPLEGPVFPRFWTKGQEADAATIRLAALAAISFSKYIGPKVSELVQARDSAKDPAVRNNLDLALAAAYQSQKRWPELLAVSEELMNAYPESVRAYQFAVSACIGSRNFEPWEKLVQARLQKHPDEPEYIRSQARLEMFRGDIAKSRATLKSLIDSGKASNSDLNGFAWYALVPPATVDADAIDAAERANSLTQNGNFSIMHTLACLYARQGKTKQARDLLLKAMDVASLPEPDSSAWLALAEIAEQYGEADAARTMYARVEKEESEAPASNYSLAQQRLLALKNASITAASKTTK